MIINEENTKPHEPSLIEDVAPPHTEKFTDSNREEVRRRSIGSLYKQYLRNSKTKISALHKKAALEKQKKMVQPAVQVIEPVRPTPKLSYSVVPPLQPQATLGSVAAEHTYSTDPPNKARRNQLRINAAHDKEWAINRLNSLKYGFGIVGLTISSWFNKVALKIFPKRYTATKGIVVDWQSNAISKLKVIVPVFVVAFFFALMILSRPATSPTNRGSSGDTTKPTTSVSTSPGSNGSAGSGSSSSPPSSALTPPNSPPSPGVSSATSTTPSKGSSSPVSSSSSTGSSGSGSSVGGMGGGGSSPSPAPSPAPSPPSILPTIQLPPVPLPDPSLPSIQHL
jgi:hypothetical protein